MPRSNLARIHFLSLVCAGATATAVFGAETISIFFDGYSQDVNALCRGTAVPTIARLSPEIPHANHCYYLNIDWEVYINDSLWATMNTGPYGCPEIMFQLPYEEAACLVVKVVAKNVREQTKEESSGNCTGENSWSDAVESDRTFVFYEMGLESIVSSATPDITPYICLNAQPNYRKQKWRASVSPFCIRAIAQSTGDATVIFEGDEGSDPNALSDGETFFAKGESETGVYEVTLENNWANPGAWDEDFTVGQQCYPSGEGTVFHFGWVFTDIGSEHEQAMADTGGYNPDGGDDKKVGDQKVLNYRLRLVQSPNDIFLGKVRGRIAVSLERLGGGALAYRLEMYRTQVFVDVFEVVHFGVSYKMFSASLNVPGTREGANCAARGLLALSWPDPDADPAICYTTEHSFDTFPVFGLAVASPPDASISAAFHDVPRVFDLVAGHDNVLVKASCAVGAGADNNATQHKSKATIEAAQITRHLVLVNTIPEFEILP